MHLSTICLPFSITTACFICCYINRIYLGFIYQSSQGNRIDVMIWNKRHIIEIRLSIYKEHVKMSVEGFCLFVWWWAWSHWSLGVIVIRKESGMWSGKVWGSIRFYKENLNQWGQTEAQLWVSRTPTSMMWVTLQKPWLPFTWRYI